MERESNVKTSNQKPHRFLIVTPLVPPESGGPANYSVKLRDELRELGQEVDLIAFKEVRAYPSGVRHLMFLYLVLFRALKVDTLIILDTVSVALPAVIAGWFLGKQTIIRTGGDFVWEQFIERTGEQVLLTEFYTTPRTLSFKEKALVSLQKHIVFRLVTTLVYSTAWQRDIWREPYHIPDSKTAVIENSYPKRTKLAPGGTRFLCAWRPTGFKNIKTLEAALELTRELIQEQGSTIDMDILRDVARNELHEKYLPNARALVIPSLSEVSPNLAMEALAMGIPVILTESCGTRDRLDGAVTWIDPKDPEDIARVLVSFTDESVYADARNRAQSFTHTRTYHDVAHEFLAIAR